MTKLDDDASYTLFQRSFWKRLYVLAAPFWFRPLRKGDSSRTAVGLLLGLLALIFITTWLLVKLNFQQGEFFTALSKKEEGRFWSAVWLYFFIIAVACPVLALKELVLQRLCVVWREWMTDHLLELYYTRRRAFFRLSVGATFAKDGEGIDNPDQRIVADVESFTSAALNFIVVFLGAGMRIFSFGAILYNISMHLSVFLFFYAAFMTGAMTWLFGKRLAALNFIKRKCEADLRFSLVRVRENAESIAMYDGGNTELSGSRGLLKKMIENNVQVIWAMFGFEMFQNGTQYLTGLLPVLLVAPQYLAGEVEFGTVKQAQDAFMMLRYSLFVIANRTDEFSSFATGLGRLEALLRAIDMDDDGSASTDQVKEGENVPLLGSEMQNLSTPKDEIGIGESGDAAGLDIVGMSVTVPKTSRLLIDTLNLSLSPRQSLLIMGPSGAGKTSLLRVLCGLWSADCGHISRAGPGGSFFLPQKVYMPQGSLAASLCYPSTSADNRGDSALSQALRTVGLLDLADSDLTLEADWGARLSPGEQQRLSFARLVLKGRTDKAFLDEATSALDTAGEARLYNLLPTLCNNFISVGHRETLVQHHTHIMILQGEHSGGKWEIVTRQEYLQRLGSHTQAHLAGQSSLGKFGETEHSFSGDAAGLGGAQNIHHRRFSPQPSDARKDSS